MEAGLNARAVKLISISGTWVFNSKLNESTTKGKTIIGNIEFVSNSASYTSMTINYGSMHDTSGYSIGDISYNTIQVNNADAWTNQAYRTITFTDTQIVPKDFYQWFVANAKPMYTGTYGNTDESIDTTTYSIGKYGTELSVGKRHIFAIGVQDIIDYLSDESVRIYKPTLLKNVNFWKMFFNTETSEGDYTKQKYIWLRSNAIDRDFSVFEVDNYNRSMMPMNANSSNRTMRPAFVIDLSKIPYTLIS